jgi:hypothetical protein
MRLDASLPVEVHFGHSGMPKVEKCVDAERSRAFVTVAVKDTGVPGVKHGGAVQTTWLVVAVSVGVSKVPMLDDQENRRALP